jgi:lysylphosphatidylglycerol synthetase-like protein (DUF2156 family)
MKTLIAAILATLIVYGWNMFSWMQLPYHMQAMQTIPADVINIDEIKQTIQNPGVFYYPEMPQDITDQAAMQAYSEKYQQGPVINSMVVLPNGGGNPMGIEKFGMAVGFTFLAALFACFILAAGNFSNYFARVFAFICLGGFLSAATAGPQYVWFGMPIDAIWPMVMDALVAWTIAGIFAGMIIRPKTYHHE